MKYVEYGTSNPDVIILLHGGGLSWWNHRETAEAIQSEYRVILPILNGHAGSDRAFTTIEQNAAEIIEFIDEQLGGSVLLMGGLSLGGQILLEILTQRQNICRCAILESTLVIPSKLTHALIRPMFESCYGLIRHKWFSKLQFRSLRIKQTLFEDYYRDTCAITKQNMIAFMLANSSYRLKSSIRNHSARIQILVGEKETLAMRRSAKILSDSLHGSTLCVLPRLRHGELSINHACDYTDYIRKAIGQV